MPLRVSWAMPETIGNMTSNMAGVNRIFVTSSNLKICPHQFYIKSFKLIGAISPKS